MTLLGSGKVGANCSRSMDPTLKASAENGCSATLQSVAELSALRRSTARARWLRSKTDISCKSSECSPDGGTSSRPAAAREMRRRIFAASGSQAPVASSKSDKPSRGPKHRKFWLGLRRGLLGGSSVVLSGVISRLIWHISIVTLMITPFITMLNHSETRPLPFAASPPSARLRALLRPSPS